MNETNIITLPERNATPAPHLADIAGIAEAHNANIRAQNPYLNPPSLPWLYPLDRPLVTRNCGREGDELIVNLTRKLLVEITDGRCHHEFLAPVVIGRDGALYCANTLDPIGCDWTMIIRFLIIDGGA